MPAPIRIEWFNRAGGSGEYGAHRIHGTHAGFDSYTLPKATIYGTAAGGVVIGKGYVSGGWGHYVDVRYPGYTQRDCHMNEASGLSVGAPVSTSTALGRVGRTGNAANIFWVRNGVELWHVHSELYLAQSVQFSKRTNPLPVWGATTAGGGGVILIVPAKRVTRRKKKSMTDILWYCTTASTDGAIKLHSMWYQRSPGDALVKLDGDTAASSSEYAAYVRKNYRMDDGSYPPDGDNAEGLRNLYTEISGNDIQRLVGLRGQVDSYRTSGVATVSVVGASKADVAAEADRIIDAIPTSFTAK